MADITPSVLSNSIMGKLYDVLTNGDDTVPKSPNNFFSWETPGVPMTTDDFRFLNQGFVGVVQDADAKQLLADKNPAGANGAAPAAGATGAAPTGLTDADLNTLRAKDANLQYNKAEQLAALLNFIPDVTSLNGKQQFASKAVQTNNGDITDVYSLTLTMSQVMQSDIPADEQAKITHLRSLLTTTTKTTDLVTGAPVDLVTPSPLVLAYNSKMTAYDNAALAYNNARINALAATDPAAVQNFAINAPILRNQVNAAMADWVGAGYKNQYEEIAAYIAQVEGRDMALLLAGYKDDLAKAKLTNPTSGSDFFYTGLAPGDFYQSTGWTTFYFTASDFARYSNSQFSSSGWSVKASGGFMGFGAHGGASHEESKSQYTGSFSSDHCSMRFDICQVSIVRPWLKTSFLNSKTWRFDPGNPDVKNNLLSDGASPPQGLMPAYPTSVILIRNLQLDFGNNRSVRSYMTEQEKSSQGGGVSFSLGPFSIGSSAAHSNAKGDTISNASGSEMDQGMCVPGMQIIGYRCHVLPKSPNPSPDIKNWI